MHATMQLRQRYQQSSTQERILELEALVIASHRFTALYRQMPGRQLVARRAVRAVSTRRCQRSARRCIGPVDGPVTGSLETVTLTCVRVPRSGWLQMSRAILECRPSHQSRQAARRTQLSDSRGYLICQQSTAARTATTCVTVKQFRIWGRVHATTDGNDYPAAQQVHIG